MPSRLAALTLAFALALQVPLAEAAEPDAARATAETLVEEAHGALAETGLSEAEKNAQLKAAVTDAFAFDVWERFLLGDRIEELSEAERVAFREKLPGFLADLYRSQFGKGLEAKPEITGERAARNDMLVSAGIPRANGKTLPVDWRIRDFGDRGHLVIDVMVGGVSFLVLKREEFAEILKTRGPEGLLAFMDENSL